MKINAQSLRDRDQRTQCRVDGVAVPRCALLEALVGVTGDTSLVSNILLRQIRPLTEYPKTKSESIRVVPPLILNRAPTHLSRLAVMSHLCGLIYVA